MSALTSDELLAIWQGVVDPTYGEPLVRLGDGKGLETYGQMFAQLKRVSTAIDVSTQALYLLPSSAQSSDPAAGESLAYVQCMQVQRSLMLAQPLILGSGLVWFEEQAPDWGLEPGTPGMVVGTGRLYTAVSDFVLMPGQGFNPMLFMGRSERPGWGYNNPAAGTITGIPQPGRRFEGSGASVVREGALDYLVMTGQGDPLVPAHVGQYIEFVGGANRGQVRRVVAYERADGGRVRLERTVFVPGVFSDDPVVVGERAYQASTGAVMKVLAADPYNVLLADTVGIALDSSDLTFDNPVITFIPTIVPPSAMLMAETGTAAWRVLDWARDLGVTVTNTAQPTGGRLGVLDALGEEHNLPRATGEPDSQYRERVAKIADLICPNAVRRGVNRALIPYGLSGVLREAGDPALLPGLFYDLDAYDYDSIVVVTGGPVPGFFPGEPVFQLDPTTGQIAYGTAIVDPADTVWHSIIGINVQGGTFKPGLTDVGQLSGATVFHSDLTAGARPENRYRWWFSIPEMRAFFLVGVPRVNRGEFGFAYDSGQDNAYDLMGAHATAYDGWPTVQAAIDRTAWQAANAARAAGVRFDLILETP